MTSELVNIFRPEWTCGRYDEKHRVAIYYNLIEGMAYFFEEESASVIGEILHLGRNGCMSIGLLSKNTCLSEDTLRPFLEELKHLNLITSFLPSHKTIEMYRRDLYKNRSNVIIDDIPNRDSLPIAKNTAEMEYSDRTRGIGGIMIELTYNCSEKCIHCYNIGATRNDSEKSYRDVGNNLSLEEYKRIIDEFYDEGLYKVCLTGGDPFVNPFIWDIETKTSMDEFGVVYANEGRRLIMATRPELIGKDYFVPDGVLTICDGAFGFCRDYLALSVPWSIKVIGDYIFGVESGKIVIRGQYVNEKPFGL